MIPRSKFKRILSWVWKQKSRTMTCPLSPSLKGKIVLITGGTRGIGLETVKGLLQREAEVIVLSKNNNKVIRKLRGIAYSISVDLGDIRTINRAVYKIEEILMDRKIDILINNAGIALKDKNQVSVQGYELTYAVNVLGHHALFKKFHKKSLLSSRAHIIAITGDIYFFANNCTSDFKYKGKKGVDAYSRSKVGVMWWAYQVMKHYSQYKVNIVHPGVIPMGLGNSDSLFTRILEKFLLTPKEGAQTTLICATQEDIEHGAYYHNALGKVELPIDDIALDTKKAKEFWNELERIYDRTINKYSLSNALGL